MLLHTAMMRCSGWSLDFILNTHHHFDHTGGNLELKLQFPGLQVRSSDESTDRGRGRQHGVRHIAHGHACARAQGLATRAGTCTRMRTGTCIGALVLTRSSSLEPQQVTALARAGASTGSPVLGSKTRVPAARVYSQVVGPRADAERIPGIDVQLGDGDSWQLGQLELRVFDTPGHTKGCGARAPRSTRSCMRAASTQCSRV